MAAPNGVQPTVCRVIFIYNFGPISTIFYIYHIENLFFYLNCGVMEFSISHVLNLQTVNWKGGWGEKFFLYTVVNWFIRIRSCME